MVTPPGRKKGFPLNDLMEKVFSSHWVELVLRWCFGWVFLYASLHKIIEPAHFAKIIYGYYLFPAQTINLIAIIIPFVEFVTGMALITGIFPRAAALIDLGLLLAFIVALTINIIRGHKFDCGCFSFGEAGYTSSAIHLLVRNIICFVLGVYVLFYEKPRKWCVLQTGSLFKNVS